MLLKFFRKSVQKILRSGDCMHTVALPANCKCIKVYTVGDRLHEFRYLVRGPEKYLYLCIYDFRLSALVY